MALTSTAKIQTAGRQGDVTSTSPQRTEGIVLAFIGLVLAAIALIGNLNAYSALRSGVETSTTAWTFGLTTLGFGTIKTGIAVILVGILVRLYMRVETIKRTLPHLVEVDQAHPVAPSTYTSRFGKATVSASAPKPLAIHRMAERLWAPMVAMGAMAVIIGFFTSLAWAGGSGAARAWTQGLQFLGEAMILSGISLLLGAILSGLRSGGAEVQEHLGVAVKTLKMPGTAKAFVALMMAGMGLGIAQFVVYLTLTGADAATFGQTNAWLGPFRELSLGLLLSGIVLALATIAKALGFQFDRIVELIKTGR